MTGTTRVDEGRLARIEERRTLLEGAIASLTGVPEKGGWELPTPPWEHLVRHFHKWRRQLYIKGRNMTASQLVNHARANNLTREQTAADLGLPIEAVDQAFQYAEENVDLIASDSAYERHLLKQGEKHRVTPPVPR